MILLEFKDLLADLCSYRDYLRTNAKSRMQMPTKTGARSDRRTRSCQAIRRDN